MSTEMNRRECVTTIAAGVAAAAFAPRATGAVRSGAWARAGELVLPPLPYDKAALEPHIDAETMGIHHDAHHKAYVDKANAALAGTPWADMPVEKVLASIADLPDDKRTAVRNNLGGHANHSLFWTLMAPAGKGGGGEPSGPLADAITAAFGSFGAKGGFKEKFATAGTGRFGSGWAWLVVQGSGLAIVSTANQDTPLMGEKVAGCAGTPILGLDVWEHAYYLKYRNLRAAYIEAWWNVTNWARVAELFAGAKGR